MFGADKTYFVVNGTSGAIQVMTLSVVNDGDSIIIPRNIHKSVLSALILSGAKPVFLLPSYDPYLGFALGIEENALSDLLKMCIRDRGTPAEETIGGKVVMAEAGVFSDIDAAFIAHPGQINSLGGSSWASHPIEITFHGRSAHAGGNPQAGINALDACVSAYTSIRMMKNCLLYTSLERICCPVCCCIRSNLCS